MVKLLSILLVSLVSSPAMSAELLNNASKQELKNAFYSQAVMNAETVVGVELGVDLNSLNRLLNAPGDIGGCYKSRKERHPCAGRGPENP